MTIVRLQHIKTRKCLHNHSRTSSIFGNLKVSISLAALLLFLLPFMDWNSESKYIQMLNLHIIMDWVL